MVLELRGTNSIQTGNISQVLELSLEKHGVLARRDRSRCRECGAKDPIGPVAVAGPGRPRWYRPAQRSTRVGALHSELRSKARFRSAPRGAC